MGIRLLLGGSSSRTGGPLRRGFSLVELLVVIFIIGVLVAILMPALGAAREASRKAQCGMNMKNVFMVMSTHADKFGGTLCAGGFDWKRDGCLTDYSWVGDCVNANTPVGDMLCPSNPALISSAYDDLMNFTPPAPGAGCEKINYAGSPGLMLPDGSIQKNPCRAIIDGAPREDQIKRMFAKKYNTNYCASWFLVRTGPILDDTGKLTPLSATCPVTDITGRSGTIGPLNRARTDTGPVASSYIPLLGDGAGTGALSVSLGDAAVGSPMAARMTRGPRVNDASLSWLAAPNSTKEGVGGWWDQWMSTLQDYRSFGPVHGGSCNVMFADGSVRLFYDKNADGQLNNGFTAGNGFSDATEELPQTDFHSRYSVMAANRN